MSGITSLAHVCLRTTDLERHRAFYGDALGLEVVFRFTRDGAVIGHYLKASPRTFVEVFLTDEKPAEGRQPLNHFCLETDDLRGLRERLVRHGYAPREIVLGADQSWQFWITDPDGLDLEFHQYTEESAQFGGREVEVNW